MSQSEISRHAGHSDDSLETSLAVCEAAVHTIESSLDELTSIISDCLDSDDETGARYASGVWERVERLYDQTVDDLVEIESEIERRASLHRSNRG